MVYAKCGGQTECIMGNWKIENAKGALAQYLRESFGQKKNLTEYFSGKTRSLLHSNKAQRSFFPLQSFARKT